MNHVIFLDIDGVLNSNAWNESHQKEISNGTLIDSEKVMLLGELVKRTNAGIILHSGWKHWFTGDLEPLRKEAEILRVMLEKEGLSIAGFTPDHSTEEIRKTKKFSIVKAEEIIAYLEQHPDVTHWIVIDDLDLHHAEIERHRVKTDADIGLTAEDVRRAEKLLLGTS
ncbi:MAG: hypothetical protein K2K87_01790 [Lachnospiraceae bacterium]|nr:hypothetical protein [Lachnospiraceae bacterium]